MAARNVVTWDYLKELNANTGHVLRVEMPRGEGVAQAYKEWLAKPERKSATERIFGGENCQVCRHKVCSCQYKVTQNIFPYFLEDGISHDLIWFREKPSDERQVQKVVEKNFPGGEVLWFENEERLRSCPELSHFHIFSR